MSEVAEGQRIGEYHLLHRIAVGGMAEVWKARAYGLAGFEKTLVIKKILHELTQDQEFVRMFVDEARIAVLLQHPNIVQVFDLGQTDGSLYMAMEYIEGDDLSKILKRLANRRMSVSNALFIVAEVLKALRFAHEKRDSQGNPLRLVHCDISPQNVLLSHSGEVKITDFGISRAAFQLATLHDTVRGKYAYMSPEQIENREVDHRSDIFSLGIVMWEALTGKRLFKGRDKDETLARVKRAEVPSPRLYCSEISETLEGIVLKALARRPEQRFADAGDMLDALGLLMVAEGHRVTNTDLSTFLQSIGPEGGRTSIPEIRSRLETMLVLAVEPTSSSGRVADDQQITAQWGELLARHGAQIWEKDQGGILAVWLVEGRLDKVVEQAQAALAAVAQQAKSADISFAAGLAPGRTRIFDDTRRPGRGWELAGPFYLSRWLMNRSHEHLGCVLATGLVAAAVDDSCDSIGVLQLDGKRAVEVFKLVP